jgi:hypothetical protein
MEYSHFEVLTTNIGFAILAGEGVSVIFGIVFMLSRIFS